MMKVLAAFVGISGFVAVLMGAAATHWLNSTLEIADLERIEKAATYQMYHTLALLGLFAAAQAKENLRIKLPSILFMIGVILFSGSLYAYSFSHLKFLVYITPFGGTSFMLGWLAVIFIVKKGDKL